MVLLLILCINKSISQEILKSEIAILNDNNYKLTTSTSQIQNNATLITQIGNQNQSQNTIIANQSIVQVFQNGHLNTTEIYRVENEVYEYIYQNGNKNTIHEMSMNNFNFIENQYIQNGDGNRITSIGSNSISDNIKIQINGNNASIIIINR